MYRLSAIIIVLVLIYITATATIVTIGTYTIVQQHNLIIQEMLDMEQFP